jgi:hypothetical protein
MADDPFEKLRSLNLPPAAMQGRDQQAVLAGLRKQVGLPEQSQFVRDVLLRQGLGQGVLLGAGDEAEAFARSKLYGTNYDEELARVRGELSIAKAERPTSMTAAEVVGSFAPAVGITALTGGAAAPAMVATLPARIGLMAGQGALGGVIQGGVEGYLKGEGSAAQRLDKAAEGAMVGGGIGAAVGGALPVAGAAFRAVSRTPEQLAAARLQGVMKEAGTTPDDLLRTYQQQQARGVKPEVLGEMLPPTSPVMRETERLANAPGSRGMAEALEQRALSQPERVEAGFRTAIGQQKNIFDAFDDLANVRMQQAKPLYDDVLPKNARSAEMDDFLLRLYDKEPQIFKYAKRVSELRDIDPASIVKKNKDGSLSISRDYTYGEIDAIQRELKDTLENAFSKSNRQELGRVLKAKHTEMLDIAQNASPEYRAARAIWADTASAKRAMESGQQFLKQRAELTAREIERMPQADKEAYLVGVFDAVNEAILGRTTGQDIQRVKDVTLAFQSGAAQKKIEAAIKAVTNDPVQAKAITDELMKNIGREARMMATRAGTKGSRTAPMTQETAAFVENISPLASMASELASGGPTMGMVANFARNIGTRIQTGMTQARQAQTNELLGKLLLSTNEADIAEALRRLQQVQTQPQMPGVIQKGLLGGALGGIGQ